MGQPRSGGRDGSAATDDLTRYWRKLERADKLVRLARVRDMQVQQDWEGYCDAFDAAPLQVLSVKRRGKSRWISDRR